MVRLILALLLLANPAAAACFGPPLPQTLVYADGTKVEILSHTAQDLTLGTYNPDGSLALMTLRDGLFPLTEREEGATARFEWLDDLPAISSLYPGFHGEFDADMVVEHSYRSSYHITLTVLRADQMTIGGCPYRVIVLEKQVAVNGRTTMVNTEWLSPDLRIVLRVEGEGRSLEVSALE